MFFQVLSDPQKRAIYDQYGEEGLKDMPLPGSGGSSGFPDGYNPQNAEDIFAEFFGSSPFGLGSAGAGRSMRFQSDGGMFGGFGRNNNIFRLYSDGSGANVPKKPPPIESKLPCSFEALYNGSTRKTKISRTVLDAYGRLVPESEILTIEVKPGWKKGTKITFPDKGNEQNRLPAKQAFICFFMVFICVFFFGELFPKTVFGFFFSIFKSSFSSAFLFTLTMNMHFANVGLK